jgi:GMP synthase (glutamine-hydrolysing)
VKRVLVCKHIPQENLGFLRKALKERSVRIRYVNFGRDPESIIETLSFDLVILLGGKMGVYETNLYPHLNKEIDLVRAALEAGIPVLGICLGAQLLAKVLGGEVAPLGEREMGWKSVELTPEGLSDPVLKHLRDLPFVFQMHGDGFTLPPQAVHLAFSSQCRNQAFRWGKTAMGLQFHLESDQTMIDACLKDQDLELALQTGASSFRAKEWENSLLHLPKAKGVAQKVFSQYLTEIWGPAEKKKNRNWHGEND